MGNTKTIFLGKRGRIFGPFSESDITRMRESGDIEKYSYLWDLNTNSWAHLESPPPPPLAKKDAPVASRWEAVCIGYSMNLLAGVIQNVGPEGCDLIVYSLSDSPHLSEMEALQLNVLDPGKNVAVNVKASVGGISRNEGAWIYRLLWPNVPEL